MKKIVVIFFLIFLIGFVSADIVDPGTKRIEIQNTVTNIQDFPNYIFIAYGNLPNMCPPQIIENDGKINPAYKFCIISVYAIQKSNFNLTIIQDENKSKISDFFNSSNVIKVLEGIQTSKVIPVTSSEKVIMKTYEINLSKTIIDPKDTVIENNNLIYLYIILPVIAIVIIAIIVIKRKK
jgi:hypothetical protein